MAFAEVDRISHRNLLLMGMVALLVIAAAFWGSEVFVLRHLRSVVTAAKRLQAGDLSARSGVRGRDEMGQLAGAFNEMAGALEQRIAERNQAIEELRRHRDHLNEMVRQRTVELEKTNEGRERIKKRRAWYERKQCESTSYR